MSRIFHRRQPPPAGRVRQPAHRRPAGGGDDARGFQRRRSGVHRGRDVLLPGDGGRRRAAGLLVQGGHAGLRAGHRSRTSWRSRTTTATACSRASGTSWSTRPSGCSSSPWASGRRGLRVQGEARVSGDDPLIATFAGAQLLVRVTARAIFPNCPRYIPRDGAPSVIWPAHASPCRASAFHRRPHPSRNVRRCATRTCRRQRRSHAPSRGRPTCSPGPCSRWDEFRSVRAPSTPRRSNRTSDSVAIMATYAAHALLLSDGSPESSSISLPPGIIVAAKLIVAPPASFAAHGQALGLASAKRRSRTAALMPPANSARVQTSATVWD